MFFVKFRQRGEKRFRFLTPGGGSTGLRIHAARFESREKAQALIDENMPDNPEFEFTVQPAPKPTKRAERERFVRGIEALLTARGARRSAGMYAWEIDTPRGLVMFSAHPASFRNDLGWVAGRLDNSKAVDAVEFDSNPYSGKWNHYYLTNWTVETALADFARQLGRLGIPESAVA